MKAVSIHDGVRVKVGEVAKAVAIIERIFMETWGITPTIKTESNSTADKAA